jgi:hypothetical protein
MCENGQLRRIVGRILICGVVALAAIACESAVAPFPSGATPFAARPEYALWWRTIEQCSGSELSLEVVTRSRSLTALGIRSLASLGINSSHALVGKG